MFLIDTKSEGQSNGFTLIENLVALSLLSGALSISAIGITRSVSFSRINHQHQTAINLVNDLIGILSVINLSEITQSEDYLAWRDHVAKELPQATTEVNIENHAQLNQIRVRLSWTSTDNLNPQHQATISLPVL